MESRFGIPQKIFADYLLFERKKSWFLIRWADQMVSASQLKVTRVGLRAFKRVGNFVKPTTRFIQIFGRHATKANLQVNMAELRTLIEGGEIGVDLKLDNGYVILINGGTRVLGLGFYINGKIRSQLPRKEIRNAMLM